VFWRRRAFKYKLGSVNEVEHGKKKKKTHREEKETEVELVKIDLEPVRFALLRARGGEELKDS